MTIWKFPLAVAVENAITMPAGARVLSVQMQNGQPTLWAMVDPSAPPTRRRFRLAGTGLECSDCAGLDFLATLQDGPYVWHVFAVD